MNSDNISTSNCLVVVPAFNEEKSIAGVVDEIIKSGLQCVVVDDSSNDRTAEIAKSAGAHVLRLPLNLGVGGALRSGIRYAVKEKFHAVIQVDADGQHPVGQIEQLIDAANTHHADLVIGSRFKTGISSMHVGKTRRFVMRLLASIASNACNTEITDATSGFRLIQGSLLFEFSEKLPAYYLGDTFEALVAAGEAGYKVIEIPAVITDRQNGQSTATRLSAVRFTLKGVALALLRAHVRLTPKNTRETG